MRFGVIRNIAGNIEAFGNADLLLDHSGVDVKVCLGQIVGIYPFVDDCVEFLINGRYLALRRDEEDEFVGDCRFTGWSTTHLVDALRFARSRVAASSLKFLAELPVRHVIQGVAFESRAEVRGGVLNDPDQVADAFLVWRDRTVFHAAHFDPYVWREDLTGASLSTGPNILDPNGRLLISTGGLGSIYQGSLNDRQSAAMVFDDKDRTVQLLRPMCDLKKVFDSLRAINYPRAPFGFLEKCEYEAWR